MAALQAAEVDRRLRFPDPFPAGELPDLDADLFIAAGVVAEQAARDPVARVDLAGILHRALEQAAALRGDQ